MKKIISANKKTDPFILTIFGASGDLAQIKLFPALYELAAQKRLPSEFYVCGFSRTKMSQKEFRATFKKAVKDHSKIKVDGKILDALAKHVHYYAGQYKDIDAFRDYHNYIHEMTGKKPKDLPHLAYLSVPPSVFRDVAKNIAETRESKNEDIRIILEKPFGDDEYSAEELFHFVSKYFKEDQFYLLDHYLGKHSVRSILNLRHDNKILSQMMRGTEVANIQITAVEDYGVKERAGYFDQVGIVKDMVQSHLLQILAMVTMQIPVDMDGENLQRAKHGILSAIECPCDVKNLVLGQYKSYRSESEVDKKSKTPTFAAMRLFINREDWYDVPIYIRTGKKLHEKHTYVVVELKKFPFQKKEDEPNRVIIELQPKERINLTLINRQEDVQRTQDITTTQSIACDVDGCMPEHALLLLDVLRKEKMHFLSFPEIIAAWEVVDQVSELMQREKVKVGKYADGSEGPKDQNKLTALDGFRWYDVHGNE